MKAYISCPIPVAITSRDLVAIKLMELGYTSSWWIRATTYTEEALKAADIFVLMGIDHKFDYKLDDMSRGCRKELMIAQGLNKPLYMSYWKADGTLNIYPIKLNKLDEGRVLGTSGMYLGKAAEIINDYQIY